MAARAGGLLSFLQDPSGIFDKLTVHVGYDLWELTLPQVVEDIEHNDDGMPPTLILRDCGNNTGLLQLGRNPWKYQWFCPTRMRVQPVAHATSGREVAAQLIIEHRLLNQSETPMDDTFLQAEVLVLVIPVSLVPERGHFADVFDHLLETHQSKRNGVDDGILLEYSFIQLAQQQRLDGQPAWLLPEVLTEEGEPACRSVLPVLFQEAVQTTWLPPAVLRQPATPVGGAPEQTKMIPATLRRGYLARPSIDANIRSLRASSYFLWISVVTVVAVALPFPVACLKKHSWSRRRLSGVVADESRSDAENSSGSGSSGDDATDTQSNLLKVLGVTVQMTTFCWLCMMGMYPFNFGYMNEVTCFSNFPWERHLCVVLFFAAARVADVVAYALLPEPRPGHPIRTSPFWRCAIKMGFASAFSFANLWYDLVCLLVARACGHQYWHIMLVVWLTFSFFWFFVIPTRCLLKQCSPKVLLKMANLDMAASCLEFKGISGRDVKWLKQAYLWRCLMLNMPMMTLQLMMLFTCKVDLMIFTAMLFTFLSLVFSSVSNAKTVQVLGTRFELEAFYRYRVHEQLRGAMQDNDLDKVKHLLSKANTLQLRDDVVLSAEGRLKQDVQAQRVSRDALEEQLEAFCAEHPPELARTAATCLGVLAAGVGGAIILVLDAGIKDRIQTQELDGGALRRVLRAAVPNICGVGRASFRRGGAPPSLQPTDVFQRVLEIACAHTHTDRWDKVQVDRLGAFLRGQHLPDTGCVDLLKQPMDGAMVLDYDGNVLEAAVALKLVQQRWCLKKADGTSAGTRHAAAFSAAFWLSQQAQPGIVFVRSDSGGVHCFFGGNEDEPPQALYLS